MFFFSGFENKIKQEFSADQKKNQAPVKKEPQQIPGKPLTVPEMKIEKFELNDIKKELQESSGFPVKSDSKSPFKRELHSNDLGYEPVTKKRASWVTTEVKQENV